MSNGQKQNETEKKPWQEQALKSLWMFLTVAAVILFYSLVQNVSKISEFFSHILGVLSPVVCGLILAYLLDPIVRFYEKNLWIVLRQRCKNSSKAPKAIRIAAALLTLLTAVAGVSFLGVLVIPEITNSVTGIIKELPSQIDSMMGQLESRTFFDDKNDVGHYANEMLLGGLKSAEEWLKSDLPSQLFVLSGYFYSGVRSVFSAVFTLIVGMILSTYIAIDKEKLMEQVRRMNYSIFPTTAAKEIEEYLSHANLKLSSAIRGKIVDSMIIGMICFIVLSFLNLIPLLNFPYPVLLAVIVGVTNVVPFFGPYVGGFITGVLVLFADPSMLIPYIIWIVVLQQFDCNFLDPHIVGSSIGLRPFWSIFACLLGSALVGIPGFVLGPPIFAFVSDIVTSWSLKRIRNKNLTSQFPLSKDDSGEPPQASCGEPPQASCGEPPQASCGEPPQAS